MRATPVHRFTSHDGANDAPDGTADFELLPRMGRALDAVTGGSDGLLIGRNFGAVTL
jgi:hypothetical protein